MNLITLPLCLWSISRMHSTALGRCICLHVLLGVYSTILYNLLWFLACIIKTNRMLNWTSARDGFHAEHVENRSLAARPVMRLFSFEVYNIVLGFIRRMQKQAVVCNVAVDKQHLFTLYIWKSINLSCKHRISGIALNKYTLSCTGKTSHFV